MPAHVVGLYEVALQEAFREYQQIDASPVSLSGEVADASQRGLDVAQYLRLWHAPTRNEAPTPRS